MKSGVAVQLRLAASLTEPSRDVTYVFYDCEEVDGRPQRPAAAEPHRPELLAGDFAVLMEPSSGEIEGGCQGTLRAEVAVGGERAHTARSWMGRNAIHDAAAVLDVLRDVHAPPAGGRRPALPRGPQCGRHPRRRRGQRGPGRVRA